MDPVPYNIFSNDKWPTSQADGRLVNLSAEVKLVIWATAAGDACADSDETSGNQQDGAPVR